MTNEKKLTPLLLAKLEGLWCKMYHRKGGVVIWIPFDSPINAGAFVQELMETDKP